MIKYLAISNKLSKPGSSVVTGFVKTPDTSRGFDTVFIKKLKATEEEGLLISIQKVLTHIERSKVKNKHVRLRYKGDDNDLTNLIRAIFVHSVTEVEITRTIKGRTIFGKTLLLLRNKRELLEKDNGVNFSITTKNTEQYKNLINNYLNNLIL